MHYHMQDHITDSSSSISTYCSFSQSLSRVSQSHFAASEFPFSTDSFPASDDFSEFSAYHSLELTFNFEFKDA